MKLAYWKITSYTNGTSEYYVSQWSNGAYTCTCPHFIHKLAGTGEHCKHIKDVTAGKYNDLRQDCAEGYRPTLKDRVRGLLRQLAY